MTRFTIVASLVAVLMTTTVLQAQPGLAPFGTAIGEYYSDTGEIIVSVNSVVSWFVISESFSLTGDPALHLPLAGGGVSDNNDSIGENLGNLPMSYNNLNLGSVAATGLPLDDLSIFWLDEPGRTAGAQSLTYLTAPVGNYPPTAVLDGPYVVDIDNDPLDILLDASRTVDDGLDQALSYKWDLGADGTFEIDTGLSSTLGIADVTSTFGGLGTYPVAVEVYDGEFFDVASSFVELVPDTTPMELGPGPAAPGTAIAAYDPATGQIIVSVNDVINWFVKSGSRSMTGDPAMNLPAGGGLLSDHDEIVGETTGFVPMTYTNVDLGNVAAPGLPLSDLSINWNRELNHFESSSVILLTPVPEPGSLALTILGLMGMGCFRRM